MRELYGIFGAQRRFGMDRFLGIPGMFGILGMDSYYDDIFYNNIGGYIKDKNK